MDVTNLSLDDYIQKNETLSKILQFQKERYSRSFNDGDVSSNFTKFDRPSLKDNEDDSDEDMLDLEIKKEDELDGDLDVTCNVDSVCSDPVSEVLNKPLREFITMEKMNGIHIESQQWRLDPINVIIRRKQGMPYLIKRKQSFPCIPKKYLTGSVKDGKIIKTRVVKKGNLVYKYKENDNGDMIGISTCRSKEEKKFDGIPAKETPDPSLMLSKFLGDLAKQINEPDDGPKIKPDAEEVSAETMIPDLIKKALNKMQKKDETPQVQEVQEDAEDEELLEMPPLLKEPRQIRSFGFNFEITKYNGKH